MKLESRLLLLSILFISCTTTRTNNSNVKLAEDKSIYFYEQSKPYINIPLLGDYKFQSFKKKYFRDIDNRFIKYSISGFINKKPSILYAAHTYVQPFYSTLCMQYKDCILDTNQIKNLNPHLKADLKSSFTKIEKLKCGTKQVYKIVYQVTNPVTKIYSSNTEYFFSNKHTVYRLFLWTTNSDDSVLANEAEYIIKESRFD